MDTGFNEELNDEKMPLHWPLGRLAISSACSEVFRSPFVVEGRVKHLVLYFTCSLRFEGPTSEDFGALRKEAVDRGDIKPCFITVNEGTPEERQIEIIDLGEMIHRWMADKYGGPQDTDSQPQVLNAEEIKLRTLEIIENDAMDTFIRLVIARAPLALSLDTLSIRSTQGLDFYYTTENIFHQILPQIVQLKTFVFSVGEVFGSEDYLRSLYKIIPPNISTLRFRGPVSLAKSEKWSEWIKSFENPGYLPNLKTLSFVLDLSYEKKTGESSKKEVVASEEALREAKQACNQLYAAAEKRGITIEPFHDKWADTAGLRPVDERWEML